MPVEHAVIGFQGVVLVEDKPTPPRIAPVIQKLVQNASRHDSKVSYQFEGQLFSVQVEHEIVYIVVTTTGVKGGFGDTTQSPTTPTMMAYTFIAELQSKFKQAITGNPNVYPSPTDLNPARCSSFASAMATLVRLYTENPNHNNKMVKLKSDIEAVKTQMLENIDSIVKRGGDIDRLCDKTDMLAEEAVTFNRNASTLRHKMLMRNIKIAIAIFVALCILGLVISFVACGIDYHKCKSDSSDSTPSPSDYFTGAPGDTFAPISPTTAAPPLTTSAPTNNSTTAVPPISTGNTTSAPPLVTNTTAPAHT